MKAIEKEHFVKIKDPSNFICKQRDYFGEADRKHFNWFVSNPYIMGKEKELLACIIKEDAALICEVGCGMGANVVNLRQMGVDAKIAGVDYSFQRINFCKDLKLNGTDFINGDGLFLPFKDNAFDLVFCKNLLHHVCDKDKVVSELIRICKPRKKIVVIEGNGLNLINILFRFLNPMESGMKDLTPFRLNNLVKRNDKCEILDLIELEPCNLFRVILHYKWGLSYLAEFNVTKLLLDISNELAKKLIPKRNWAYMLIECVKK